MKIKFSSNLALGVIKTPVGILWIKQRKEVVKYFKFKKYRFVLYAEVFGPPINIEQENVDFSLDNFIQQIFANQIPEIELDNISQASSSSDSGINSISIYSFESNF
jgi:hypothetical protein